MNPQITRKPYIVILGSGARYVAMWRADDLRMRRKFATNRTAIYGPYATEAEATDNLEGEPNPALRIN